MHNNFSATERFIKYLAESSFDKNSKSKILEYKDLANFVESNDTLDFLHPILPQKITVKKFREIMAKEKIKSLSDSDTTSEGKLFIDVFKHKKLFHPSYFR